MHFPEMCFFCKWTKNKPAESGMAGVPINPYWVLYSGGWDGSSRLGKSFLLNAQGDSVPAPNLSKERSGACSVVLQQNGQQTQVGVLGGYDGNDYLSSMERYNCDFTGQTPTCTKTTDGPAMNFARYGFGCGTLQTTQVSPYYVTSQLI